MRVFPQLSESEREKKTDRLTTAVRREKDVKLWKCIITVCDKGLLFLYTQWMSFGPKITLDHIDFHCLDKNQTNKQNTET